MWLIYTRTLPGLPQAADFVYRPRHGGSFQSYSSLNRKLLRASRFLRLSADRRSVAVVDGTGTSLASYASDNPIPAEALEISTKYVEDGFNSVWGIRSTGSTTTVGWAKLWLLAAKTEKDGTRTMRVVEIPGLAPDTSDEGTLSAVYVSPDVDANDTPRCYAWRSVRTVGDSSCTLWELSRFGSDGKIVVLDRFAWISADGKWSRLGWDAAAKDWRRETLIDKRWANTSPVVAVSGSSRVVVCRSDGLLRILN